MFLIVVGYLSYSMDCVTLLAEVSAIAKEDAFRLISGAKLHDRMLACVTLND